MYLIERLEADRQDAEEALHNEKRRKRFLENKIDSISLWKQQEHAFIVQRGKWLKCVLSFENSFLLKYYDPVIPYCNQQTLNYELTPSCFFRTWGLHQRHHWTEVATKIGKRETWPSPGETCTCWGVEPALTWGHWLCQKTNPHCEGKPGLPEGNHKWNQHCTNRGSF